MKTTIYTLIFLALALGTNAQDGKEFPSISGETLQGGDITLPESSKGKFTIVGMAYSPKAEDALRTWFNPAYDKFIIKSGMFDDMYDVNVYFIAMFTGVKQTVMNNSKKKMRKSDNTELFPHILYYRGELKKYKAELGLLDKEKPYFFVLDKEGKIVHHTSGNFSDSKMEAMEEFL